MTALGERSSKEVIKLKWGLQVGPDPVQQVSLSEEEMDAQRDDCGKRQREGDHQQAQEKPQRKPALQHLDPEPAACRTVENQFVVEAP